jgi:hypothetical protein
LGDVRREMPAKFVKGDFINEAQRVEGKRAFACPVDVSGRTDAGIASAVAKRWPGFAEWWSQQRVQLGDIAVFEHGSDVIFALAMLRGASRSKLSWLDRGVRAMLAEAEKRSVKEISVPRLWGGPSALDGARSKRIIDDAALPSPITLVVFEQFIRAPERAAEPALDAEPSAVTTEPEPSVTTPAEKAPKKRATAKKKAGATKKKAAAAPNEAAVAPKKKAAPVLRKVAAPKRKAASVPKKKVAAAPKKKATAAPKTAAPKTKVASTSKKKATVAPKKKATATPTKKTTAAPKTKATVAPKKAAAPKKKRASASK